jgi:hypothetical protein
MVIERLELQTDAESGDFFIVSGRSLESILLRRIFDRQFLLRNTGSLNGAIWAMIQECTTVHAPETGTYRRIEGLTVDFKTSFDGTMQAQFTGSTLYDAIVAVCQARSVGFKMTISGSDLVLSLYQGSEVDVIFSPEFDNLLNSNYVFDKTNLANTAYVGGEGQGNARKWLTILTVPFADRPTGLALREMYVDARDVSSNDGAVSDSDYWSMLSERGHEKLAEHEVTKTFEAEIEPMTTYRYKVDYNLGDIVTVTNEYGVTANPRIVEIVESWDESGYTAIPTFDALDVEDESRTILRDSAGYILRDNTGAIITVKE